MAQLPPYLTNAAVQSLIGVGAQVATTTNSAAANVAARFPDSAFILRLQTLKSGLGGAGKPQWVPDPVPIPCNLFKFVTPTKESVEAGELKSVTYWLCGFPLGSDVQPSYKLSINGFTYEVVATDAGRTQAASLEARLARITLG